MTTSLKNNFDMNELSDAPRSFLSIPSLSGGPNAAVVAPTFPLLTNGNGVPDDKVKVNITISGEAPSTNKDSP